MLGQYVYLAVRQRRSLNLKDCVATNLPKSLLFPAPTCSSHRREQTSRAACWQILVRRSTSGQSKKLSQTKILVDSGTHCIRFTRKEDLRRWPIGQFASQFQTTLAAKHSCNQGPAWTETGFVNCANTYGGESWLSSCPNCNRTLSSAFRS